MHPDGVLGWVCDEGPPGGNQRERDSATLLTPFWVSGVRIRTEALSGLSLSLWPDSHLVLSDFWMEMRKEGGNGDLAVSL